MECGEGVTRYTAFMRTPQEAVSIILARARARHETETVPLAEAAGRVLGADAASDIDIPPFPKSAMDGFAVRHADFAAPDGAGPTRLRLIGESRAGEPWGAPVGPGECVAIFTGAEVPADCDTVVIVEKSRAETDHVLLDDRPRTGQHVCLRGEDLREGEVVLRTGTRLTPAALASLASIGCEPVPVFRRPRVAILTTGDELVPPTEKPGPGQIRESNTIHLAAMTRAFGAEVVRSGVVRDVTETLSENFRVALEEGDLLLTTGGVSVGKYDLVGEALEACGVEKIFHKVAIKPGKPVWFGAKGDALVLGLPGNPVSSLVSFEVFVRPLLGKLSGLPEATWSRTPRAGFWSGPPNKRIDRQYNVPVRAEEDEDGRTRITPVPWQGSADIVGMTGAMGMAIIPPETQLAEGDRVSWWRLD